MIRVSTDSLKTGLVILKTVNIKHVPVKNVIALIEDLLEAREVIEKFKLLQQRETHEDKAYAEAMKICKEMIP
jgi:hypothetical protein